MDEPLLPCPFCGVDVAKYGKERNWEPPTYRHPRGMNAVGVRGCICEGLTGRPDEWNRRAGLSPIARTEIAKLWKAIADAVVERAGGGAKEVTLPLVLIEGWLARLDSLAGGSG